MSLIAPVGGYASLYDEADLNGDIVAPGAFAKSLARGGGGVKLLYQHAAESPIGRWTRFEERKRGLFVHGEILLETDIARDVYALLRNDIIDGLSIGFRTVKSAKAAAGRRILEAELWEVSIVTFPMAPKARLTFVGAPQERPDLVPLSGHKLNDRAFADAVRRAATILSA